jgi:hypothetical protein
MGECELIEIYYDALKCYEKAYQQLYKCIRFNDGQYLILVDNMAETYNHPDDYEVGVTHLAN